LLLQVVPPLGGVKQLYKLVFWS